MWQSYHMAIAGGSARTTAGPPRGHDMDSQQLLVTMEEGAQMLGCGRTAIYELVRRGEIESIKLGRSRRIPMNALEAFVQRLRQEQADDTLPDAN